MSAPAKSKFVLRANAPTFVFTPSDQPAKPAVEEKKNAAIAPVHDLGQANAVNPYVPPADFAVEPDASPCFAIDVECVANGPTHNDRVVAHIAIVDQSERVICNFYVKPKEKVFSYLPALTGLSEEHVNRGLSPEEARKVVKQAIPSNAKIIGQGILKDVQWLQLEEGKDFASLMDLSGQWTVFNPTYGNYSRFSLHHKAKCLLKLPQIEPHNAVVDAIFSMRLYNLHKHLSHPDRTDEKAKAEALLLSTPTDHSFAFKNPSYDGVCMGQKRTCTCGAAFFFV